MSRVFLRGNAPLTSNVLILSASRRFPPPLANLHPLPAAAAPNLDPPVFSYFLSRNPLVLDGVEDMTTLSYLGDGAVLHNLRFRYSWDLIYTYTGPLLIAINPYKKLDIYGTPPPPRHALITLPPHPVGLTRRPSQRPALPRR
jgi:hypothetical protein